MTTNDTQSQEISNSKVADTRNSETVTSNSTVASGKDTPKITLAITNPALPTNALRFIGRIEAGTSTSFALQQIRCSSEDLLAWKQIPDFLLALEGAEKLRSTYKRADAEGIAERNAAYLMAEAVGIGLEAGHANDRLRAIQHVHAAIGIGAKSAGTSVTVNVDASARAWSQSQEQ